ncbi:zf-HC2 domain-containing protein [Pandoraea pneumonica]|uniref:anti-sigma factor family protein n=1 Tax=Pandoraea pneumonica TaxID=2508299 RepID=UPI003CED3CDB
MPLGKCRAMTRTISDGLDRRLTVVEAIRLRLHLSACDGCRHYRQQVQALRAIARIASGRDADGNGDL